MTRREKPLPPIACWFVVDEDGWPFRGPFVKRASAIKARQITDTTARLRVVAYVPRTTHARKGEP